MNQTSALLAKIKRYFTNTSPQKATFIVVLIFGTLFAVITPPFQAPDEASHFYRAYQVSELHLFPRVIPGGYGDYLPQSTTVTANATGQQIQLNSKARYRVQATFEQLNQPLNSRKTVPVQFNAAETYSPIAYIPQAIGIFVGRIMNLSPILLLLFGRLANVIFWASILYLAIKITPVGKWGFAVLGLTPMALFMAGSVSEDVATNGLAFLLFAWSFYVANKSTVTLRDKIILGGLAIGISLTKIVYLPLLVVLFILPHKSLGGKFKKTIFLSLILGIALLFGAGWQQEISKVQGASIKTTNLLIGFEVKPRQQLDYILKQPVEYIKVVWNTYFTNNGNHITNEFIGTLGSLDVALPTGIIIAGYTLITLILVSEEQTILELTRLYKIMLITAAVIMVAAISTAMYLYSSPFKYVIIVGLQGRYFIPISLVAIPLTINVFKGIKITPETRRRIAINGSVLMLSLAVIFTAFRYYAYLGELIAKIQ